MSRAHVIFVYNMAWARLFACQVWQYLYCELVSPTLLLLYINGFAWDGSHKIGFAMNANIPKSVYSKMLEVASSVLELSYPVVRSKYVDMPICFLEYIENGKTDNIIEVRFDETGTTLSCSFNEDNICDVSFLFWDNIDDITNLVYYLNNCYEYDFIKNRWVLPNCYLSIEVTIYDAHITLYKDPVIQ